MNQDLFLEQIQQMVYSVRGQRIMLDQDLARLYQVETKYLNKAVKRNLYRFPPDFMFQLTSDEFKSLAKEKHSELNYGGRRYLPFAFTENGVAMLSSVLNSKRAILVNISIMRLFTRLRSFLLLERELNDRVTKLENDTTHVFRIVFKRLDEHEELITPQLPKKRKKIGL